MDFSGPHGTDFAAVGLGRTSEIDAPADGVRARQHRVASVVELRVPFTLSREELDNVERGANDVDLDAVKDAAKKIAFAEDRAIFEGYAAANIEGIRASSTNAPLHLPEDPRDIPETISLALSELRLAGVGGPYSVLLSADAFTKVSETSDHGYPIREQIRRLIDGDIIWRRRSTVRSSPPPAAATTTCRSGRTCRSATCRTTRTTCSCTSRKPSRSSCTPARPRSRCFRRADSWSRSARSDRADRHPSALALV